MGSAPHRSTAMTPDAIEAGFVRAGCDVAMHVLDLATGSEVAIHADRPVVLASVFKIFVALEFYAQVAAGRLDPAERLDLDNEGASVTVDWAFAARWRLRSVSAWRQGQSRSVLEAMFARVDVGGRSRFRRVMWRQLY